MKNLFTKANVVKKEMINPKIGDIPALVKITIKIQNNQDIPFRPGQFCTFRIMEDVYRAYSIASSYKNFSEYSFLISCGHEGLGSNYFKNISIGEEVIFLGPNGHFSVLHPVAKNIKIFCTGTGIAPIIPIIEFLTDNNCDTNITLIHGLRDETNLDYYQSIHEDFVKKCPNISSKFYISQPKFDLKDRQNSSSIIKGRVVQEVEKLKKHDITDYHFYLCGHPDMVYEMFSKLKTFHVPENQIMAEEFTSPGYF
jgi:ferredoxin-NADP reductase